MILHIYAVCAWHFHFCNGWDGLCAAFYEKYKKWHTSASKHPNRTNGIWTKANINIWMWSIHKDKHNQYVRKKIRLPLQICIILHRNRKKIKSNKLHDIA